MRIETDGHGRFRIARGYRDVRYFCFFVDYNKSSWSNRKQDSRLFKTVVDAEKAIAELRDRVAACRKELKP